MEKIDCRWVIQTQEPLQGDLQKYVKVKTHALYMQLTEEQIELMNEIFGSSDKVYSFICGRKIDGET